MTARFDSPKAIVTGGGCRNQTPELLTSLHARRALIVVDPFFATAEFVNQIRSNLAGKGIVTAAFTEFQPDPTDQNVAAGAERFRAEGMDSIIAIGGGSAVDAEAADRACRSGRTDTRDRSIRFAEGQLPDRSGRTVVCH